MLKVRWEWRLILAVVAFAKVEDLEMACLEAVGVAVVVEKKFAVVEALLVADAAHTAVAVPETAAVPVIAAVPLLVSAAERAAHVEHDVASEGPYELPPPLPPAVPDGVVAPAEVEAVAELLLSELVSLFLSPRAFWWERSDLGSAPARHGLPSSRCLPRR